MNTKPCPRCGTMPDTWRNSIDPSEWGTACLSDECEERTDNLPTAWGKTEDESKELWNKQVNKEAHRD